MSSKILSNKISIDIPLISISKLVINQLKYFGNKVFIIEYNSERCFTFSQLAEDCLRMSQVWLDLGLKVGQTFGICGDNSYEYMVCFLSGVFIGGIAVPMRAIDTLAEFERTLKHMEIKMFAVSQHKLQQLKSCDFYTNITGIVFGASSIDLKIETHFAIYENLISKTCAISEEQIYCPKDVKQDICVILESSGTTGLPKGCLFSHYNLVSLVTIGSLPQVYNRTSDDIVSGHSYSAHISGVNQLLMSINNGSQLILHPIFNFNDFCSAIQKHKITALSAPASIFMTLLKTGTNYDISSLKKVICGGAPLPRGCAEQIVHKYPHFEDFRQGYGMTEMTILITFGPYGSRNYDSVGGPTPGNQIKVVDCLTGDILPPNQTGEIWVTGPTLFKGYYKNSEATNDAIDSDNYLHSGDLGYYDQDDNVFIVDRIKLMLKTNGMQVSPIELESVFLTHCAVKDAAVVGKPDNISGQLPTAFVVIKDEYKDTIKVDDILIYVNSRITPLKQIKGGIYKLQEIPKNKTGKTDRNKLLDILKSSN